MTTTYSTCFAIKPKIWYRWTSHRLLGCRRFTELIVIWIFHPSIVVVYDDEAVFGRVWFEIYTARFWKQLPAGRWNSCTACKDLTTSEAEFKPVSALAGRSQKTTVSNGIYWVIRESSKQPSPTLGLPKTNIPACVSEARRAAVKHSKCTKHFEMESSRSSTVKILHLRLHPL